MNCTKAICFQWSKPETQHRELCLVVQKNGQVYLGRELKRELPPDIFLGFDPDSLDVAIADGQGKGCALPKGSYLLSRELFRQLIDAGFLLPAHFVLTYHRELRCWIGVADSKYHMAYDVARLLVTQKRIISRAIQLYAKTTPLDERRAIATEEFCAAVASYDVECGSLVTYIEKRVHGRLLLENKRYTAIAAHERASMEAPLTSGGDSALCLGDIIADPSRNVIDAVEEKVMAEQFSASLSDEERKLLELLAAEFTVAQIARELRISEETVISLGQHIGQKRKQFYQVE